MNILLYVITVITLLTITTYLRLENLISSYAVKKEFTRYLKNESKDQIRDAAETWYQEVSFKRGSPPKDNPQQKSKANRKLSWFGFFYPELAQSQEDRDKIIQISKTLIHQLFKDDLDFQRMSEQNPNLVTSLITRITEINRQLPQDKKVARIGDLCTLDLNDAQLNQLLYLLIQGYHKPLKEEVELDSLEEVDEEPLKSQEKHHISLLNFVTERNAGQIRVFLASKELLKAIFEDDQLVHDILETRCLLYRRALQDDQNIPALQAEFERFRQGPYASLLDFTISKTNPKSYE